MFRGQADISCLKIYGRANIRDFNDDEMARLNLGCGLAYRPEYINVDRSDQSVADVRAEAENLPFANESVESIEAIQLIEHFDLVHCRYVLSEWFRVLMPGGLLILEAPDLKATLKKLASSRTKDKISTAQWLFGIDSPGLLHKSGFTSDLLEEILADVGYEEIKLRPARTHLYAPGLRVECKKPMDPGAKQFLVLLRQRIKNHLESDDSYVLIPLEGKLKTLQSEIGDISHMDANRSRRIISIASVWNPKISSSFIEECLAQRVLDDANLEKELDLCTYLSERRFHERALTLWTRSKKGKDMAKEFAAFVERTADIVKEILEHPERRDRLLEYVMSLEPTPIMLLDLILVRQHANASLNNGIVLFHKRDFRAARGRLTEALRADPQNALAHWNLARLGVVVGDPDEVVLRHYVDSISLAIRSPIRAKLEEEKRSLLAGDRASIEVSPVSEYDLIE